MGIGLGKPNKEVEGRSGAKKMKRLGESGQKVSKGSTLTG